MPDEATPTRRGLKVVHAEIDNNFRAAAYALVNCFLAQQRILNDTLKMTHVETVVFLTVGMASMQKLVRHDMVPDPWRGTEPWPDELIGTISRRAVAAAAGLPRETTRRIIAELIRRGHLIEAGPRAVRTARASIRREGVAHVPSLLATEALHMIDQLQRAGVLVER